MNKNKVISFSKPSFRGNEYAYLKKAMSNCQLSGDGSFTKSCHNYIQKAVGSLTALLTTSCTHALEMTAILAGIKPGDEVIMPSYTFVSTANAFVLRGARIIFVDIRPDTMNIDESRIEEAITRKTKVIVPVHYAGVSCDMDVITDIAKQNQLLVVEDAAQAFFSTYKGKFLGGLGDLGAFSFHDTKNLTCGEGGALLINNSDFLLRSEIIREKGTNRSQFFRGEISKYSWQDIGSSYLPSELNAAILLAQLEQVNEIQANRLHIWEMYFDLLSDLALKGYVELPVIPEYAGHNAHIFFIKVKDREERVRLLTHLSDHGIQATFHYVPLHNSLAGKKYGVFRGKDQYTTLESDRLLRLPLHLGLSEKDVVFITDMIKSFYLGC